MSNSKVRQAREEARITLRNGHKSVAGIPAETLQDALTRIYAREGSLRASAVLEDSRPEDAPLHPAFEWDDAAAAEQYRLDQARSLIRSVTVVMPDGDRVQQWIHVPNVSTNREGEYHPPEVIVAKPDLYALAVGEASARVQQAEASVRQLKDRAQEVGGEKADQLARITIAMQALQTASAAVSSLH
jgi:hypothetical protein